MSLHIWELTVTYQRTTISFQSTIFKYKFVSAKTVELKLKVLGAGTLGSESHGVKSKLWRVGQV